MQFKDYFSAYDTLGNLHNGFLQSMDFSGFTDITFLNELTMALMDAHLFNELSGSLVMRQWAKYMHFSKANDRLEVLSQFYTDFKNALYAKLQRSEKWYQITETDFTSLSATDIKTIEHGSKVTDFDYAQAQKTKQYGQDQVTTQYGQKQNTNAYGAQVEQSEYAQKQDTTVYGSGTQTTEYGATEKTTEHDAVTIRKDYDRVVVDVTHDGNDTHVIGAATTTATHKLYPLGASDFVNDTQDSNSSQQQTNTDSFAKVTTDTGSRADAETTGAHDVTESTILHTDVVRDAEKTDTRTSGAHTDVVTEAAHTDTLTEAQHTDTETRSQRTDTETDAAKKDTTTIKAYTDTERHTKHIVLSPDKYFEIQKELTELGVYDLMTEAVRETMLLSIWEEEGSAYIW